MDENDGRKNLIDYNDESQLEQRLSEIDKLIKKENIDIESLFNSFDSDTDKEEYIIPPHTSSLKGKNRSTDKTTARSKNKKDSANHSQKQKRNEKKSKTTREKTKKNKPEAYSSKKYVKERKSSTAHSSVDTEKNGKSLKIFLVIFALIVIMGACGTGVFIYFNGYASPNNSLTTENITETTVDPHELLAVITVSDKTITFNGEEITENELESKLNENNNLTLSLINVGANPQVYNAVATILNNHGGSYELMDNKNTNPSINTDNATTSATKSENHLNEESPANSAESNISEVENQE
ncbi:MAG: hypothetical protein J1F17_01160 [Oscillospiraceae bacterium]|nr:hypothetical protein [Oscillospiraceae bacterium]